MAAKKQQTHAKRARELAVKERRERKREKKALRAAGGEIATNGSDSGDSLETPELESAAEPAPEEAPLSVPPGDGESPVATSG